MKTKKIDGLILVAAVIGSLVLLNVIGTRAFGRLDFTRDKQFTLSDATKDTLVTLEDVVTIKAYFTKGLSPQNESTSRYVRDLLDEYYANARGNLSYEFIDPVKAETEEDKEKRKNLKRDLFGQVVRERTSMETELQALGIAPFPDRVLEDDKFVQVNAYMALVVQFGEKTEVIPRVMDTTSLEYDLTTLVRRVTRASLPKVALLEGFGVPSTEQPDPQQMQQGRGGDTLGVLFYMLQQLYDAQTLDLSTSGVIPNDLDGLIVAGASEELSGEAQRAIDQYVQDGGSVAFFVDRVKPVLQEGRTDPSNSGLWSLLESYGVTVEDKLVLDPQCASISVQMQVQQFVIPQQIKYPYLPVADTSRSTSKVVKGIPQAVFPFSAPLVANAPAGVELEIVASSSAQAWTESGPYDLNPQQKWTQERAKDQGEKTLMVAMSGALPSPFGQSPASTDSNGRVLVAGGSTFLTDQYLSNQGAQALALNVVDWLVLDEGLLAIRGRGLGAAPLEADLSVGTKTGLKWFNALGLPFIFIAFGLMLWRVRESRRRNIALA